MLQVPQALEESWLDTYQIYHKIVLIYYLKLAIYYFFFRLFIKILLLDILIKLLKTINNNIKKTVITFNAVLISSKLSKLASELYNKVRDGSVNDRLKNKKL